MPWSNIRQVNITEDEDGYDIGWAECVVEIVVSGDDCSRLIFGIPRGMSEPIGIEECYLLLQRVLL